ncbi:serine-rich adhesin for platelets isoform X2 [Halyomorpha halys]|uniref:serine-rich adhesin for platelets isoform X2 n=1 Tax=Halyomorpha halys TaxID=286706 RepID=UPI0006D522F8|nr:uncharacterized protein LOC106686039 isoform X2 [Halyomorpha halys]
MVEWEARCLALEQAYVHEVYHQMGGSEPGAKQHPPWPRVTHFLNQLEPGSIVCDVGCGSGKYLNVNPSIFKLGVDRCSRLAMTAREEKNEVMVCDNLALPFRDESFDAVLSIAVVHHFATTERRITALKELARILRIGGRLVISVWAMEQRHRKFESQDVLVPWHRPQAYSSPSVELTPTTTTSEEETHQHLYTACTHTSESDSAPSTRPAVAKHKTKHKEIIPSPSSSSLSSPNESCYSFVRRAFKKLTGVKRSPTARPWFLDSWTSCATKDPPPRRYDPEGCEDIQDLPIELRHLEGDGALSFEKPPPVKSVPQTSTDVTLNHKSKSLSDIITNEHKSIVRSQSSFPTLEGNNQNNVKNDENENKPKLVKQKQSMCDEDVESEERDEATDMKDLIKSLPEFKISAFGLNKKGNVFKQSSMNEELMSAERLREKEKVRQNIQKQASLNEELIFNRNKTLDSIRDTFFSASTAKRLQLLKNGLTNKFKSSTTGIEKVSGASLKNGFVRILQGWASGDLNASSPQPAPPPPPPPPPPIPVEFKTFIIEGKKDQPGERRHSREDGSDSSKDSSLQSDTSVDSEDSFASVIFIPKADQLDQPSSTTSPTLQSTPGSPQPTSPKIKYPPPISPKMKNSTQMSFGLPSHPSSPKLKHPNQLINSPTPSSPKMKYFPQPTPPRTFQPGLLTSPTSRGSLKFTPSSATNSPQVCKTIVASSKSLPPTYKIPHLTPTSPTGDHKLPEKESSPPPQISTGAIPKTKSSYNISESSKSNEDFKSYEDLKPTLSPGTSPTSPEKPVFASVEVGPLAKEEIITQEKEEEPLDENLKIVQEIVRQKVSSRHYQFPLVRRSSTMFGRTDSPPYRPVPRLLSLEIFNPETDDMDSDSSGLSSPDSVGSVISIKNEEETITECVAEQKQETALSVGISSRTSGVGAEIYPITEANQETLDLKLHLEEGAVGGINPSPRLSPLLEAAADVANTLEETVETVIQSSPQPKRKHLTIRNDSRMILQDLTSSSTNKSIFNEKKNKPVGLEQAFLSPLRKTIEVPKKLLLDHDKISKERMSFEQSMKMEEQQGKRWDEECRQHLAEFAEKLSEKLLAEIDRYREQSAVMHSLSPIDSNYGTDFSDIQDPYLFKLNEDLHDLTKLSIELHEENIAMKARDMQFRENESRTERVKAEGASMEEKHIEQNLKLDTCISNLSYPNQSSSLYPITPDKRTIAYLPEEQIPLLEEYSDDGSNSLSSSPNTKPSIECTFLSQHNSPDGEVTIETKFDCERKQKKETTHISTTKLAVKEKIGTNEKYGGSEETWVDSRRNTILPTGKSLLTSLIAPSIQTIPDIVSTTKKEETTKIELLPAKDMPRRPSISVEMTDSSEKTHKEEILSECALHLGVSLESSEAGDISERTGSSSEGSRPSSRRDTIQISHSPSIFSLKPGLSIESSDAGDISERTGSDGSRDSRKDIASLSDITSGSQNSLLRPGNSVESSDAGDVSDRTGSDISRQNTSSAGKTPSTASITSDKASDCSKDARFADRRMARCDGRSSSEEMPLPRSSMNKLVRQRASTQEPSEILAKAQSCETSLSGSTSQDSLLSDSGGGAITFHRYYHVFREGELDQLIEKYVENLHIISSYYDHANWCIIAEKVQVWTI